MQQDNSPIRMVYNQLRANMNQEQKRKLQRLNDDRVRAWRAVFTVLNRQQGPVMANLVQQDFNQAADKKAIVDALRREIEELSCSVCFETVGGERGIYIATCSHCYCNTCLEKYEQSGKTTCPLCRKTLGCAYREGGESN